MPVPPMMHPGERALIRQLLLEHRREHLEERAAILEFEAGLTRAEAERVAKSAEEPPWIQELELRLRA